MNLDGINVFVEVIDAGSFTGAARRLGMPTSTVSARIARLEAHLGVTLLHRTTRQINPTVAGLTYYHHCVRALAELSEAELALADTASAPSGRLRISAPGDLTQSRLVPLIDTYLRRFPRVQVDLVVTSRAVDLVAEGIDLAIRVGTLRDSSLVVRKFFETSVGLWASPAYLARCAPPERIAQLSDHSLIDMRLASSGMGVLEQIAREHALSLVSRITCDDMQSCKSFIEHGAGIGPLPDFVGIGSASPTEGQANPAATPGLVRVLPQISTAAASAYFVYPTQRFVPPTVRSFIDFALQTD